MTQPYQPQFQPQPVQPPPQPPKKKLSGKVKLGIALAILLWLGACGAIIGAIGGSEPVPAAAPSLAPTEPPAEETTAPEPEPTASAKPKPEAKIGDRVTDGELSFVVTSVKCGATRVGDEYLNTKAQGQFCMVKMKVKNISDGPTTFDGDNQTLINTKGQEFSADTEAMFYANDDNQTFLEEINPGNQVTGTLVYDIPKKSKPDHLLLKAGVFGFSEGVIVDVS